VADDQRASKDDRSGWWQAVPSFPGVSPPFPFATPAPRPGEDVGRRGPFDPFERRAFWQAPPLTAQEIMTSPVRALRPEALVSEAAELMRTENIGVVPVVNENERLMGLVTDRDLVTKAFGRGDELRIDAIMTRELEVTGPDEPVHEIAARLGDYGLQRLPVVDRVGRLLGIVSLDDLARRSNRPHEVRQTAAALAGRGPAPPPAGWQREPLTAQEIMRAPARAVMVGTSLPEVVATMKSENVGILPVVDNDQKLRGVITDRDILVRLTTTDQSRGAIMVEDVMTTRVETAAPGDQLDVVLDKMHAKAVHRLPVVDREGTLVGIVSIDDVAARADFDEDVQHALARIAGRRSFWRRLSAWTQG
jgi:CBS domain-containing protein